MTTASGDGISISSCAGISQAASTTSWSEATGTGDYTILKMVDFSYKLASAFPEDAVSAAPPPQQFKTAPPGHRTREHRTGPHSSHHPGQNPVDSLNRIGSAARPPQPVLLCKRRSQLPQDRPQYLHTCFTRFLTGTAKATWAPLPTGQTRRRGMRSEQPSRRRASTKAAAWCSVSP